MPIKKTNFKTSIGVQIKALRLAAGLKQMDLAIKLGATPSQISLWETGRNLPDSRYLESICVVFWVELRFIKK